jgi:uncharacterized protein YkwD
MDWGMGVAGAARQIRMLALAATLALGATAASASAADVTADPSGGCAAASVAPAKPAMRQAAAGAILCLINIERRQRALPAVLPSSLLAKAAAFHSADMVRRHYFSHVTPNGQDLRARIARTGYTRGSRSVALGETLAWGADYYATPAALVKQLMQSPVHKAIIVDRRFRDIGVGLALGAPLEGMGSGATLSLNFGRR